VSMATPSRRRELRKPVETTSQKAAAVRYKTDWLRLRQAQEIEPGRTWVFTDGSSSGWFAAVIIDTKAKTIRRGAAYCPPTSANIGPELCGLILGLELAPAHSPITVVHDYTGIGAWAAGHWKCDREKPKLRRLVAKIKRLVRRRRLDIHYIHHGGHQDNGTDFTRWNCEADELCTARVETDVVQPWV
jgi:hypothetical protein